MTAARIVSARRAIVFGLLALALAVGAAVPSIEVRFEPEELAAPDDSPPLDDVLVVHEEPIVVAVEAHDVLTLPVLRYMHTLARELAALPGVARVDGPTTTPLPRSDTATAPSLENLDALDDGPPEVDLLDPTYVALGRIVTADPERWPLGMISFANDGRRFRVAALVAPDHEPTADDLAVLESLVASSSLVGGRIVSLDRRMAVLVVTADAGSTRAELDALIASARARTREPPEGTRVSLSGLPAIRLAMVDALEADQVRLVALAFTLSLLVLLVGMRSAAGVLLPLGTVGITVVVTVGAMALADEPLNLLTNMIPPLLVTIGLAEAVHMVLRWEELAREGLDAHASAVRTLETMALPCLVTTGTTAIGFGALVLQETAILRHFGVIAAIATMVAYGVTVLFVPSCLPFFRPRAARSAGPREGWLERALVALADLASRRAGVTIGIAAVLFVVALFVARDVTVDSTLMDQFARGSDVARTTEALEAHLDGVRSLDVVIEAAQGHFETPEGLARLAELTVWLRDRPGVLRATSVVDWLAEARRLVRGEGAASADRFHGETEIDGLRALLRSGADGRDPTVRFVSSDGARARIEVRLADRGASRILAMIDELEAEVTRVPGYDVRCGGEAFLASRGLDRIVRSLGSLGAAVALIFLVMTLLFRSVRLGLVSIPPNALPLALTLAYMRLRGVPLNAATVIVFTVSIGLAVDGATHVIARFREEAERAHLAASELVRRTIVSSGRGVVLSSATLLLGYGALLSSTFEPVRLFGELSAVAIAGSLIAQIVLLPALLSAFARPRS